MEGYFLNSTIDISCRYLESDYVRALRAHYASHLRLKLDIVVVIVLAAIGAYLWQFRSSRWLGVVCLSIAALFSLILVLAFTVIPPMAFRRNSKFRDEYSLTFSAEGVHFRTAQIDSRLEWSIYFRALVDAHSYVLYHGSNQFTVIPKRVFQSLEQQHVFEQLLAQHVVEIERKGT